MNDGAIATAGGNPFSNRTVLALVLFGALVFVALLWMIGAGMTSGSTNDGGNHAGGKGLTGFAAFSTLLEKRGYQVRISRSEAALDQPGLLVLTPPHLAEAKKIDGIITRRRFVGPTLLILPKWFAAPVPAAMRTSKIREGWVIIGDATPPFWGKDLATLGELDLKDEKPRSAPPAWAGFGGTGRLPDAKAEQTMSSGKVLGLVSDDEGQVLAGYLEDGASHPELAAAAGVKLAPDNKDPSYPLVIVAEPDLINNYGFSRKENALLALALVEASMGNERIPVIFDLTLNGLARNANLLTLAFTPPFLAATLCLMLAGLAIGWRAFLRFGPPRKPVRAIAFGKRALVGNTSGLLRRARRLHLIAGPYVERTRDRISRSLALPRHAGREATDAAIDRAMAARSPDSPPFTELARQLRSARNAHEIVKAAQDLHALERTLTR